MAKIDYLMKNQFKAAENKQVQQEHKCHVNKRQHSHCQKDPEFMVGEVTLLRKVTVLHMIYCTTTRQEGPKCGTRYFFCILYNSTKFLEQKRGFF